MTLDPSKSVADRFERKHGIRVTLFRTGGGLLNKTFAESRVDGMSGMWLSAEAKWCYR